MPLVWFALAWLAGIAAGSNLPLQGWQWGLLAATSSILAALFQRLAQVHWQHEEALGKTGDNHEDNGQR